MLRILLRTAEAAARRLIFIEAQGLATKPYVASPPSQKGAIPKGTGARMPRFSVLDPLPRPEALRRPKQSGAGRLWLWGDPIPEAPVIRDALPDDLVDATRLCHRLQALHSALESLPRQARRVARWQEKRRKSQAIGRRFPLRLGRPPGHRKRPVHPVDGILAECHALMHLAMKPPDPNTATG